MKEIILILFKHKQKKIWISLVLYGLIGLLIEVFDRAISGSLNGYFGLTYVSLCGWTSLWMLPVYSLGMLIISILNEIEWFYKLPIIVQSILCGLWVELVELLFGILYLKIFHLNVWDYSNEFMNFYGIICLKNYVLFTLSTPLATWIIDTVGVIFYGEEWSYHVLDNYKKILRELKILR